MRKHLITGHQLRNGELSSLRGGFTMPSGLQLSFGYQQHVLVNDIIQVHNTINIPDIGLAIKAGRSPAITMMNQQLTDPSFIQPVVIQRGAGNFISSDAFQGLNSLSGGFITVIQNTLDNQVIRSLSVFDFTISNISSLRSVNVSRVLNQQLVDSIGR